MAWSGSDTRIGTGPRSLAHLISRTEARAWPKARTQQVPAQRETEAGPNRGPSQQDARLEVLQLRTAHLPHGLIPPVDNEKARRQTLVVPIQDPDPRTPLQELPAVEEPAEDPLDQRSGGNQAPRPSPGH